LLWLLSGFEPPQPSVVADGEGMLVGALPLVHGVFDELHGAVAFEAELGCDGRVRVGLFLGGFFAFLG
jgi:hypothetical protein